MKICLHCKYLNTVRIHPFVKEGDRFYCHIIDLFMNRSHAACLNCHYFVEGKEFGTLPVETLSEGEEE